MQHLGAGSGVVLGIQFFDQRGFAEGAAADVVGETHEGVVACLGEVARVKVVSVTNVQPESRAISGFGAKASFTETENRRELRTENGPKSRDLR
jgi:hypothetical protein